jgi:hypothetical protein
LKKAICVIIRKNISIDQCYVDKLQPFLEKNNGNLSAAIRDAIEISSRVMEGKEAVNAETYVNNFPGNAEIRNKLIEKDEFILVHRSMFEWFVKNTSGLLIDESTIYELINPYKFRKIPEIIHHLNILNEKLGWNIKVSAEYQGEPETGTVILTLSNGNPYFREHLAHGVALYLAKQMKLDVQGLYSRSNVTKLYLKRFNYLNYEKVPGGLEEHFGSMDGTYREIRKKPDFWRNLIHLYRQHNYQRISMNKKIFESLVSGRIPDVADIARDFEFLAGKPPDAFTLPEHIMIFKELYLTDNIGSDIEVSTEKGREYIKLIYEYSDEKVRECITQYYSNMLRAFCYPFVATSSPNLILFDFGKGSDSCDEKKPDFVDPDFVDPDFVDPGSLIP